MTAAAAMNPLNVFAEIFIVSPCLIFFDHPIGIVGLSIKHRPLEAHACARWHMELLIPLSLRGAQRRSNPPLRRHGLLRGACHRARIRATRWLAMTGKRRRLLRRHHPRKRVIQYAGPCRLYLLVTEYWMPTFAGMTALANNYPFPPSRMKSKSQPSSACRMDSLNRCA